LFVTGAGISAESGLPTYRGVSGLYKDVTVDSYEMFNDDGNDNDNDAATATRLSLPPKCSACGGHVRPAVVLFDEYLGDDTVAAYEERLGQPMAELMFTWSDRADRLAVEHGPLPAYDVSIAIGTSALFAYVNAAALSGSKCIEINPDRTDISDLVDVRVPAGATEALQFIF